MLIPSPLIVQDRDIFVPRRSANVAEHSVSRVSAICPCNEVEMTTEEQWEYKTILCPTLSTMDITGAAINQMGGVKGGIGAAVRKWGQIIDHELNSLGSQGWQLVSIWKSQLGNQGTCEWMTFKRQKANS